MNLIFGPVPSRRLGKSLGINHIPPKTCSYSCRYCQLGKTSHLRTDRRPFYPTREIVNAIKTGIDTAKNRHQKIDYLAFVPDGEPTLDIHLGHHIEHLKQFSYPIAVISNGSLMGDLSVRRDLLGTDWISLKIDAVTEKLWRYMDRPHGRLDLNRILAGMLEFRSEFSGVLVTETMIVERINDSKKAVGEIRQFLSQLQPDIAYLSIPTRPPTEKNIRPPTADSLNMAYQMLSNGRIRVELLTGYEGNAFSTSGDVRNDILNITAVHPLREEALAEILHSSHSDWAIVGEMLKEGEVVESDYEGHHFFLRRF